MSQLRRGRWRWSHLHRVSQQEPDCRTRDRHREHADQGSPTEDPAERPVLVSYWKRLGRVCHNHGWFQYFLAFSRCATRQQRKLPAYERYSRRRLSTGRVCVMSGDMSTSGRKISNAGRQQATNPRRPENQDQDRGAPDVPHPVQPGGHQDGKTVERQSAHEHDQEVLHSKHRCRGCPTIGNSIQAAAPETSVTAAVSRRPSAPAP